MSQIILLTGPWTRVKELEAESQGEALRILRKVLQVKTGSCVGTDEQHLPSSLRNCQKGQPAVTRCGGQGLALSQGAPGGQQWGVSSCQEVKENGSVFLLQVNREVFLNTA